MNVRTVVAVALAVERGYKVVTQGLMISRPLTFEEWRACGEELAHIADRTGWAIGDWIVYGAGRGDYGEYYLDARAITGRSFESLSQYARVSKTFPIASRSVAVPWSFYREALRLPEHERTYSLQLAARNEWTRDGFAEFISTRDGAAPSRAKKISETRSTAAAAIHVNGWHARNRDHHRFMQCPSCGFTFEPKRRHRLTLVSPPSTNAIDPSATDPGTPSTRDTV